MSAIEITSAMTPMTNPSTDTKPTAETRRSVGRRRYRQAMCRERFMVAFSQSSRVSPAQTRVSVPHHPAELAQVCLTGEPVWHRHSCLCLGKTQWLVLLTHSESCTDLAPPRLRETQSHNLRRRRHARRLQRHPCALLDRGVRTFREALRMEGGEKSDRKRGRSARSRSAQRARDAQVRRGSEEVSDRALQGQVPEGCKAVSPRARAVRGAACARRQARAGIVFEPG